MRDLSNYILPAILVILISFGVYEQHRETTETSRVNSVIAYNLKSHRNTHLSKVVNTGYDFHYTKNNTSLTPTFLLEDGAIIRGCEIVSEQQKLAPFVKVGDSIEYTIEQNHDVRGDYAIIGAHIDVPVPIATK